MRSLIVHFSQGGTTQRVAEAIAAGLRGAGCTVDLCNLARAVPPATTGYDLLGIGSPAYYFRPPFKVMDYLEGLPPLDGLPAFAFVLHGSYRGDTGTLIRRALAVKGATELGYFHCLGSDMFLGYLRRGFLFSPGHPTLNELTAAREFGRAVARRACSPPGQDPAPRFIYRLERFLSNRWLARHLYSRLFRADPALCDSCDICAKLCPTGNITVQDRHVRWGRDCLLCVTCEMKCPRDAIRSVLDWPAFQPFLAYNVRQASRDPGLEHVRVIHRAGRTRPA